MIAFSICLIVDGVALADLEHAGRLARGGAEAAGELGEVVRRVELAQGVGPAVAVDEVVPVGDQVPERAAAVAEGHAALHAARALLLELGHRAREHELAVVVRALVRIALGGRRPLDAQEGAELAHQGVRPARAGQAGSRRGLGQELGRPLVEHAPVVVGHDLDEQVERSVPVVEEARGDRRPGAALVLDDEGAELGARCRRRSPRRRRSPCCSAWRRSRRASRT